jgi:fatty acid-binding protein DegV
VDDAGRLIPVSKARGWNNVMNYILDRMEETLLEPKDQIVFISHSDAPERAQKLAEMMENRLGKREVVINHIGPVIGAHTGPGTIALFFLGSKR